MWVLLTDRTLKGFKVYGPYVSDTAAQEVADKLMDASRIKSGYTIIPLTAARVENGRLIYEATI